VPSASTLVPAPPPVPPPLTGLGVLEDEVVYGWFFGLLAAHVVLRFLLSLAQMPHDHAKKTDGMPAQQPKGTVAKLATMPGLTAHQIVIFFPFAYAAYYGNLSFLCDAELHELAGGSAVDRLYGISEVGWRLMRFMAGFQLYDLVVTALEKDLCKTEHLLHHSFALTTALAGSANGGPWCTYYAVFFFAVVEVSSVPLCAVDVYRSIPSLMAEPVHRAINEVCRTTFALSFLAVRCLAFPALMLLQLWPDLYECYTLGDVRVPLRVYVWMGLASMFLTGLQLFWGWKILKVILKGNLKGKDASAIQSEVH